MAMCIFKERIGYAYMIIVLNALLINQCDCFALYSTIRNNNGNYNSVMKDDLVNNLNHLFTSYGNVGEVSKTNIFLANKYGEVLEKSLKDAGHISKNRIDRNFWSKDKFDVLKLFSAKNRNYLYNFAEVSDVGNNPQERAVLANTIDYALNKLSPTLPSYGETLAEPLYTHLLHVVFEEEDVQSPQSDTHIYGERRKRLSKLRFCNNCKGTNINILCYSTVFSCLRTKMMILQSCKKLYKVAKSAMR